MKDDDPSTFVKQKYIFSGRKFIVTSFEVNELKEVMTINDQKVPI